MDRVYSIVDAFTAEPFAGNPAAVVLDAQGLTDDRMQALAAEFNLSETTFVLPAESEQADYRFRWFSPSVEVAMCGHGTIAGLRALTDAGAITDPARQGDSSSREAGSADPAKSTTVVIETLSGTLNAFVEAMPEHQATHADRAKPAGADALLFWLDLPDPVLAEVSVDKAALAKAIQLDGDAFVAELPMVRTQDDDLLVFVSDFAALYRAQPDFAALRRLHEQMHLRGMSLATVNTLTPSVQLQSRFFAPACGIDEDPVTGSVHGPLAAYLVKHGLVPVTDGLAGLVCTQAKAGGRAGLIYALLQPLNDGSLDANDGGLASHEGAVGRPSSEFACRIGGHAVTVMRGSLCV